jgi:hypothetical protein
LWPSPRHEDKMPPDTDAGNGDRRASAKDVLAA